MAKEGCCRGAWWVGAEPTGERNIAPVAVFGRRDVGGAVVPIEIMISLVLLLLLLLLQLLM